jgi:hypothetical protein
MKLSNRSGTRQLVWSMVKGGKFGPIAFLGLEMRFFGLNNV